MKIIWSPEAFDDLAALHAHIAEDAPAAARRTVMRIVNVVEQPLGEHPAIGRPGRVPGTRELVIAGTPYLVPYRVRGNTLQILRVHHGARRWPERL